MKSLLFLTIGILNALVSFSQDMVTLKTGEELNVKVTEVLPTEIKYKKSDSGPTYTINKKEVLIIKYADGTKDVFKEPEPVVSPVKKDSIYPHQKHWYVSIGGGYVLPEEKFKQEQFVKNGFYAFVSGHFELLKMLGATIRFTHHELPYEPTIQTAYYQNWTYDKSEWKFETLQLGVQLFLPLSKKSSIDLYSMVGVTFGKGPSMKKDFVANGVVNNIAIDYKNFTASSVLFGADFRIQISHIIGFVADVDYNICGPNITAITTSNQYNYDYTVSRVKKMNSLFVGAGLSYYFK